MGALKTGNGDISPWNDVGRKLAAATSNDVHAAVKLPTAQTYVRTYAANIRRRDPRFRYVWNNLSVGSSTGKRLRIEKDLTRLANRRHETDVSSPGSIFDAAHVEEYIFRQLLRLYRHKEA